VIGKFHTRVRRCAERPNEAELSVDKIPLSEKESGAQSVYPSHGVRFDGDGTWSEDTGIVKVNEYLLVNPLT
jgi:hypothetical protein